MESILIKGGNPLIGEIVISGSKNGSLPIMAASLLTDEVLHLQGVPMLSDIITMKNLLENHGSNVEIMQSGESGYNLNLSSENIENFVAPYDIVRKMRASIWVLGPLLTRFGSAIVSLPGGCAIGSRQVDLHIEVMKALGATIEIKEGYIHASAPARLTACHFIFSKISVGATINAILAAVMANGESYFENCAIEPEISDLCSCLVKMGAKIENIGTSKIKITGVGKLHGTKHQVMADRIEAGTYMLAAAATHGDVNIKGINPEVVGILIDKMREAGSIIDIDDDNIRVRHPRVIKPVNMSTREYPGFPSDLQAQFMSFMALSDGVSNISENIYENRFMHVPELCRMGADIKIEGHNAIVSGVNSLTGAEVMASDLRASVSLVISGLCAQGETKVRRVYHLDRGYQSLEKKLMNCGADIKRVAGDFA